MRIRRLVVNFARRLCLLIAVVGAVRCGESREGGERFVVRDSAGVVIAVNSGYDSTLIAAQIAAEPLVRIGDGGVDRTQELYRVGGAVRIPDGRILILNGGSAELRWYDADGRFIQAVGRVGGGPGEFSEFGPSWMCVRPGNGIVVSDPGQGRAHVFSLDRAVKRLINIQAAGAIPSIRGCFADGTFLARHSQGPSDRIPGRIIEQTLIWTRLDSAGRVKEEILSLPAHSQYLMDQGDGNASYHAIPFSVSPSAVADGESFIVARGPDPEIERRRMDGSLVRIIRWAPDDRIATAGVYKHYQDFVIESQATPNRKMYWERFFGRNVAFPDTVPSVDGLLVDDIGHLWVKRYTLPWIPEEAWDIFDPDGRWLGRVNMDAALTPLHIGQDFVVGLHQDSLDIERILVYALSRRQQ